MARSLGKHRGHAFTRLTVAQFRDYTYTMLNTDYGNMTNVEMFEHFYKYVQFCQKYVPRIEKAYLETHQLRYKNMHLRRQKKEMLKPKIQKITPLEY